MRGVRHAQGYSGERPDRLLRHGGGAEDLQPLLLGDVRLHRGRERELKEFII